MTYAVQPPPITALPVAGTDESFPVTRVYCVGRNYAEHAVEMGHDPNREPPFFFAKPADSVDVSHQPVASAHRADPLRCPGHDQVTGQQLHQGAQVRDGLGNFPDLLAEVPLLPGLIVDAQPDRAPLRVADRRYRTNRAHRGGPVEAFGHIPGPSCLLRLSLHVAAGHVEPHGVPEHVGQGRRCA